MAKFYKLTAALLLTLSLQSIAMDTIVISDLDDTIKRTNVDATVSAGLNALFTQKAFPGMSDLFKTLESETSGLYVLSNGINLFRPNIFLLFKKHGIRPMDLSTRCLAKDKDKFKYKYDYIVKTITKLNVKAILIGDDIGEDPEVYAKVLEDYPNQVAGIYIHNINNREIPAVARRYYSFLDIALNEYEKGRLNLAQVDALNNQFTSIRKMKKLFPKFKYCPKKSWRTNVLAETASMVENMTNKVIKFCKNR